LQLVKGLLDLDDVDAQGVYLVIDVVVDSFQLVVQLLDLLLHLVDLVVELVAKVSDLVDDLFLDGVVLRADEHLQGLNEAAPSLQKGRG